MAFSTPEQRQIASGGFTLLELMLAITIVSVLVVLVLGAFQVGQRSWAKGDAAVEDNQRLRVTIQRMLRQLGAATRTSSSGLNATVPAFEGDERVMRFMSGAALTPGGDRGLVLACYAVREEPGGLALDFQERPLVALAPDEDPFQMDASAVRLLDGLSAMRFAYFLPGEDGAWGSWRGSWPADGETGLPVAVRITITPKGEAPIDMIARLSGLFLETNP